MGMCAGKGASQPGNTQYFLHLFATQTKKGTVLIQKQAATGKEVTLREETT